MSGDKHICFAGYNPHCDPTRCLSALEVMNTAQSNLSASSKHH